MLRTSLIQAAHAAVRMQNTYLSAQYHRLAGRRGKTKAICAVAHSTLAMAYFRLSRHEPYREAGADFFDHLNPVAPAQRLLRRLRQLGYQAELHLLSAVEAACPMV